MRYLEEFVLCSVVDGKILVASSRDKHNLKPMVGATDYKLFMATQLREDGHAIHVVADLEIMVV